VISIYTFKEPFRVFNDNGQPVSFEIERSSGYAHLHSGRCAEGYAIHSCGNKHFPATPSLYNFSIDFSWRTMYTLGNFPKIWLVLRYDRAAHKGIELCFDYIDSGNIEIYISERCGTDTSVFGEKIVTDICEFRNDTEYKASVKVENDSISGVFADREFSLKLPQGYTAGSVGFERGDFHGSFVLTNISLASDDELEVKTITETTHVYIPLTDGGEVPYEIFYDLKSIGGRLYFSYTFTGGTQFREKHFPSYKTGQWSAGKDFFNEPYIKLIPNGHDEIKNMIANGNLVAVNPLLPKEDPRYSYFNVTELPLTGEFPVPEYLTEGYKFVFGYKNFRAVGYNIQSSGEKEYTYTEDGTFISEGTPGDRFELFSPFDKQAVKLIPKTCYKYEEVKRHFELNHYFAENEDINMYLRLTTDKPLKYIRAECELQDVYGDKLESLDVTNNGCGKFSVKHAPMAVGVYRIEFKVYFGEELLKTVNHAFEVFDVTGEKCAPTESGLPFTFSTPNEQRYLDRDAFDPWNPMPSCDMEHYFPCSAFTGEIAREKRIWEVIRIFGRKWYVWLMPRTMRDYTVENNKDIVENADYLAFRPLTDNQYNSRHDMWRIDEYNGKELGRILDSFLKENPKYAELIDYKGCDGVNAKITGAQLAALLNACGEEWRKYAFTFIKEQFRERNALVHSVNPNVKFAMYGPNSYYTNVTSSCRIAEQFGLPVDEMLYNEIFDGFAQFEDYPASCAYQTYRSAFYIMTATLMLPGLKLHPEQYKTSMG